MAPALVASSSPQVSPSPATGTSKTPAQLPSPPGSSRPPTPSAKVTSRRIAAIPPPPPSASPSGGESEALLRARRMKSAASAFAAEQVAAWSDLEQSISTTVRDKDRELVAANDEISRLRKIVEEGSEAAAQQDAHIKLLLEELTEVSEDNIELYGVVLAHSEKALKGMAFHQDQVNKYTQAIEYRKTRMRELGLASSPAPATTSTASTRKRVSDSSASEKITDNAPKRLRIPRSRV